MLGVAVPYPEFFGAYWYIYRDRDFNKSIGEHTVRHADRPKLWLYLAAFCCQMFFFFSIFCHFFSTVYKEHMKR